jgi:hypothetical protein
MPKIDSHGITIPMTSAQVRVWILIKLDTAFSVDKNGSIGPQVIHYHALIEIHIR